MFLRFSANRKGVTCLSLLSVLLVLAPACIAQTPARLFLVEPTLTLPAGSQILPTNFEPTFLSGDFNGDGLLDTAAFLGVNGTASNILVLLSSKGGAPHQVVTALSNCNSPGMAAADLNNDNKLDLVLYCAGTYVQAFLGNGDGTFQAPILTTTLTYPQALALADFNGDGLPDLAYVTTTGFAIALNVGGGHFGNSQSCPLTAAALSSIILSGDFNGDGKHDLVFANGSGAAAYVLGNGDGTFGAPQVLPGTVDQIAIGDFNHDGYSDLAYFSPNPNPPNPMVDVVVVLLGEAVVLPLRARWSPPTVRCLHSLWPST
jgi:hypothetical protein